MVSLTMFDEQTLASSSVSSRVSDFSDLSISVLDFDPGPGSVSATGHAPLLLVSLGAAGDGFGSSLEVPAASDPVLSTRLVF